MAETKRSRSRGKTRPDPKTRLIEAAMRLAAERGWRELSFGEIADEAKLPLAEALTVAGSKTALLEAFARQIDAQVLAEGGLGETEGPARDRLFDVLMRRLDALLPYRDAIAEILRDLAADPLSAVASLPGLSRSMAWMLEAAGLDSGGLRGLARINALSLIYLATLRVWLRDETADLAKTMAALDRHLRRAESLAGRFSRAPRRAEDEEVSGEA